MGRCHINCLSTIRGADDEQFFGGSKHVKTTREPMAVRVLPPFLDDWDHASDIYRAARQRLGGFVLHFSQNWMRRKFIIGKPPCLGVAKISWFPVWGKIGLTGSYAEKSIMVFYQNPLSNTTSFWKLRGRRLGTFEPVAQFFSQFYAKNNGCSC